MARRRLSYRLASLAFCVAAGAQILAGTPYTGDPSADGWTAGGTSLANQIYATGSFDVTMYTTAFYLDSTSNLALAGAGIGWDAGDLILGVGGDFLSTGNSSLTYEGNGSANLHLVVKYGSSSATWAVGGGSSNASLNNGGAGSILLATVAGTFSNTNSGTPEVTSDSPTELVGSSTQDTITNPPNGDLGLQITDWSGTDALAGFETFIDVSLVNRDAAELPGPPAVAAGNPYELDLQQGTGVLQDSLGTLAVPTPEPATTIFVLGGFLAGYVRRRRG